MSSIFDYDAVVEALKEESKYQAALDMLQTLASCTDSKTKALGAAHILAKLCNQNANGLSSELALVLHLRGATDRAIGILAAAGITDTPSAMRNRIDRIYKDHSNYCMAKLSAAPTLIRVVNIDDYHAGATLRCVEHVVFEIVNVILNDRMPEKTSSSAFSHMATELISIGSEDAPLHNGIVVDHRIKAKIVFSFVESYKEELSKTFMAVNIDKRCDVSDVTGKVRVHDYDSDIRGS